MTPDFEDTCVRCSGGMFLLALIAAVFVWPLYVGLGWLALCWLLWSPLLFNVGKDPYIFWVYLGMPLIFPTLIGYVVWTGKYPVGM